MKLPERQAELLERVCLKRYRVQFDHYLGSFNPNESVTVYDYGRGHDAATMSREDFESIDRTFRPSTAEALHRRSLIRFSKEGQPTGQSLLKPTRAGLDQYIASRETNGGA